ncbi:unnamed protein product [Lactuca virosa]|uniref:Uncharacterized protein n=1 Tax=Lactuca virosa TaxID=75947 RepID=A0AAU9M453_9ASTR|nr:unnamed protein product [Lactuca virosa]
MVLATAVDEASAFSYMRTGWKKNNREKKVAGVADRDLQAGRIEDGEMKRTFNMGIGMVLVVSKEVSERVVKEGEMVYRIGEVFSGLEPSQTMIRHLVEMEIDRINTSHPNFIGGNQVVEVASHQVRSYRLGSTTPRTRDGEDYEASGSNRRSTLLLLDLQPMEWFLIRGYLSEHHMT